MAPPRARRSTARASTRTSPPFEKQNPDIDVVAHDAFPCQDPKTFDAKLAGGQMEDVFYTYFTDAEHVVDINQAADITEYVKDLKAYKDTSSRSCATSTPTTARSTASRAPTTPWA